MTKPRKVEGHVGIPNPKPRASHLAQSLILLQMKLREAGGDIGFFDNVEAGFFQNCKRNDSGVSSARAEKPV